MTRQLLKLAVIPSLVCGVIVNASIAQADHSARLDALLSEGKLAAAATEFTKLVEDQPDDQQAKAALGIVSFLQAIEGLAQNQYRYGLLSSQAMQLPIARIPVPTNPDPDQISYDDLRQILVGLGEDLQQAEQSLANVDTQDVKLSLFLGRVRFDIDGDGEAGESESLWKMYSAINRGVQQEQGEEFSLAVDGADVHWLRGYCHVLMAFCDVGLAYDGRTWFESCGQLLYPDVDSPYDFLQRDETAGPFDARSIADLIAAIHLLNFPLQDADKMQSAHQHLLAMVEQSRKCWERALAETDDDREWIPNPEQQAVIGLRVSREQIDGWHEVLDEFEAILNGDKLIPFWRKYSDVFLRQGDCPEQGTGVNLHRVFTEPRDLDIVLFLTGTGAAPYLEEGPLSTPQAWRRMTRVFRGDFLGFAVWFN